MKDFESALQPVDVLSLDIFDTALGRRYALPVDVFVAIRGHLVASRGQTFARFVEARQEAENVARGFAWNRRQAEETRTSPKFTRLC